MDEFSFQSHFSRAKEVAPNSFIAPLPQRLLGHPQGGALAVIGRVERGWGYSFVEKGMSPNIGAFATCIRRLMEGCPVGFAMEDFTRRYVELASEVAGVLQDQEQRDTQANDDFELIQLKTALRDAKNYLVLGDPAVRLCADCSAGGIVGGESLEEVLKRHRPAQEQANPKRIMPQDDINAF